MTLAEVLVELETLGTAQNRKTYARHGVTGEAFGVSYANLGKLRKKIKRDHELAQGLWDSGNHDARVLATLVAEPAARAARDLDAEFVEPAGALVSAAALAAAFDSPLATSGWTEWA